MKISSNGSEIRKMAILQIAKIFCFMDKSFEVFIQLQTFIILVRKKRWRTDVIKN